MFLDKSAENAIFARGKKERKKNAVVETFFFHSGLCLFNLTSVR